MTKYHHLSPEERAVIMLERVRGSSLRQIAYKLERSPATLSRELKRNSPADRYCATRAGAAYKLRRQHCVRPRKLLVQSLRRSKSKRGPRGSRASCYSSLKITPEQRISNRPAEVSFREVAGHWEGDLIIGGMNQSCVGTLVERKTGFVVLAKMHSKSAQRVREGFEANMINVPDFLRLSMTYDRGAEMAQHALMSKRLHLKIYFADRRAPWQRGSSENINGLLRQFLPKGEDLSTHSQAELNTIAWLLNTRPRKRFAFKTPQYLMERELKSGIIRVALDS
jgi:IS30 family transposase